MAIYNRILCTHSNFTTFFSSRSGSTKSKRTLRWARETKQVSVCSLASLAAIWTWFPSRPGIFMLSLHMPSKSPLKQGEGAFYSAPSIMAARWAQPLVARRRSVWRWQPRFIGWLRAKTRSGVCWNFGGFASSVSQETEIPLLLLLGGLFFLEFGGRSQTTYWPRKLSFDWRHSFTIGEGIWIPPPMARLG